MSERINMAESRFELLLTELQNWGTDPGEYDFNGMVHLLGACLDNMREFAREANISEIAHSLSKDQEAMLRKCVLACDLNPCLDEDSS